MLNPPQPGYTMPIMWTIRECDCSCQWALVWSADAAVVTVTLSGACLPFYLVGTLPLIFTPARLRSPWHRSSAVKRSIGFTTGCTITEKAPTRAFSWLKAPTSAFTFKTLLRHYAKRVLTLRSLNMKLGPRRNYH